MKKKPTIKRTKVTCVSCPNCADTLFSRANHDWRICTCGDTFVDGGFERMRIGAKDCNKIKTFTKIIKASKQELYDDWNHSKDQYGLIRKEK
jgi:hypothetical protein